MLIDAFTFNREYDMFEARYQYLSPMVDVFVVSECNYTFSGEKKELHFLKRYGNKLPKVIHCPFNISSDIIEAVDWKNIQPRETNPLHPSWQIYFRQIQMLEDGIKKLGAYGPRDRIMLSDVDEIPAISQLRRAGSHEEPVVFMQDFFWYNFNQKQEKKWMGTIMASGFSVKTYGLDYLRRAKDHMTRIEPGGWHLSYFMSPEDMSKKIQAFAHQEYNRPKYTSLENINACIRDGKELFGRRNPLIPASEREIPAVIVKAIGLEATLAARRIQKTGDMINICIEKTKKAGQISVICPTMWRSPCIEEMLPKILESKAVYEFILIDNDPKNRPKWVTKYLKHKKMKHHPQENNIFVNPAWNFGYHEAKRKKLCFYSDDVLFDPDLLDYIADLILPENGIIGTNTKQVVALDDTKSTKEQLEAVMPMKDSYLIPAPDSEESVPQYFGCLFFCHKENYFPIANEFKINFGDWWLFRLNQLAGRKPRYIMNFPFVTKHHTTSMGSEPMKKQCKDELEIADYILKRDFKTVEDFILSLSRRSAEQKNT